jgi:hypothetical protein
MGAAAMIGRFLRLICIIALLVSPSAAQVGPLAGMGPLPFNNRPSAAVISYTGSASQGSGTTYNFTSFPIGTAAPNRYVACAIDAVNASGDSIVSVTINSVSGSKIIANNVSVHDIELWIALVPSGTSVTITVVVSLSSLGVGIGCWSITGLTNAGAATSTAVGGTSGSPITLGSIAAGGVVIGAGGADAGGGCGTTYTWADLSSTDYCTNGFYTNIGAHQAFATAQSSYGVTLTQSGSSFTVVAASLR